jgi:hypothetical protein
MLYEWASQPHGPLRPSQEPMDGAATAGNDWTARRSCLRELAESYRPIRIHEEMERAPYR